MREIPGGTRARHRSRPVDLPERARAELGMTISRPAWKNLVFTGAPGTGKSHAARAVASAYHELGFTKGGQVIEAAAAGMSGWTVRETRQLVNEAIARAMGRVLMITGAQAWRDMRDGGPAALAALYEEMTVADHGLAVVLSGEAGPVGELLAEHRPLAARSAAVVDFPGYGPRDFGAVFAGWRARPGSSSARACRTGPGPCWPSTPPGCGGAPGWRWTRRITASGEDPARIEAADIPDRLEARFRAPDCWRPGQYL